MIDPPQSNLSALIEADINGDNSMKKCIWCMKRTNTSPCEHCQSDQVYDMDAAHTCEWSRRTVSTVECRICERVLTVEEYHKEGARK